MCLLYCIIRIFEWQLSHKFFRLHFNPSPQTCCTCKEDTGTGKLHNDSLTMICSLVVLGKKIG